MNTSEVGTVMREALLVTVKLAGPTLLMCMVIGIVIAIFQAVTQIHEQSLAFILKLIVVFMFLLIGGSWMLQNLQEFTYYVFELIAK